MLRANKSLGACDADWLSIITLLCQEIMTGVLAAFGASVEFV